VTACVGNRSTMKGPMASAVGVLFRPNEFEFLRTPEQFALLARITRQMPGFQNDAVASESKAATRACNRLLARHLGVHAP
jgi:hypothetical protein